MTTDSKEIAKAEDRDLQDYELLLIVNPEVVDEPLEAKIEAVSRFITSKGGVISDIERWGKKRMAYPVKHFIEGNYVLARFKMNPARSKELETDLHIAEEILRHMLVRASS